MKPILAFETSSSVLSVALFSGKGPVVEENISGFQNHAENFFPAADKLLKKKKLSIQKVGTFLIGRGPGSFTGLRVGFAGLKGFQILQKRNCFGALSLDLIAERITLKEGSFLCVCLDAHRDKIYSRIYQRKNNSWVPKGEPVSLPISEWVETLPDEIYLAGSATVRYRAQMEALGRKFHFLKENEGLPKASTLIDLFLNNPEKLQKLETPKDFIPLYFRLSEAEERFNERNTAPAC